MVGTAAMLYILVLLQSHSRCKCIITLIAVKSTFAIASSLVVGEPLAEAAAAADSSNYCRAGSATVLQVRCFSQLSSSAMLFSSFMGTLDSTIVLGFSLRLCSSTILLIGQNGCNF